MIDEERLRMIRLADDVSVLQAQVTQLRAEVDGLKLGMVTMHLDQPSRDRLAAMLNPKPDGG